MQNQILNMVLDLLVEHLTDELITSMPSTDDLIPDVVKKGILVDNKTQKRIQIGVQGGDHELPDEEDGIVTLRKLPRIAMDMEIVAREMGGGQMWMRRGLVKIEYYELHQGIQESEAFDRAYALLGRVMQHIETTPVHTLDTDDFGEQVASQIYCYSNTMFESGGPPSSFIFRGKVFWALYTARP